MAQGSDALNRDPDRDVSPVDRDIASGGRYANGAHVDTGYTASDTNVDTGYTASDTNVDTGYVTSDANIDTGYTAPDADLDTSDPDAIRANIERTRAEMSSTIDEIQDRLAPSNLAEQAKEAVRDATIGRVENIMQSAGDNVEYARQSFMETVRSNPIPAALVGIGLGWLFMNRRSTPQVRYSGRGSYRGGRYYESERGYRAYDEAPRYYDRETRYGGQRDYGAAPYYREGRYEENEQGMADRAREAASDVAGRARDTASDVADRARDTASDVADRARETASNVADRTRETASDLAERAQYGAQRFEDRAGDMMRENPLALGAVALAAGVAVGLMLPQTERENEWMGEARDRVVDQAQDMARDAVEKAKSVASNVTESAQQTIKEQTNEVGR